MKRITSRHNPIVTQYRSVARGEVAHLVLLDGDHLVADALDAGVHIRQVAAAEEAEERASTRDLLARLRAKDVDVVIASEKVMDALSPVRSSSAIVAIADRPAPSDRRHPYSRTPALVLIVVDVQEPGNVGAIVRVAEAGGATGLVSAGAGADPFGWKALRGSMGSALRLPIVSEQRPAEAVADARRHGCRIVATVPRNGRPLFDADLRRSVAIVIGSEGAGLSEALVDGADDRVTIPMRPPVESLNAAVAAALFVYEASRQRTSDDLGI